jgi:hypothetical protein
MTVVGKKIELLIREIEPFDKNGRYLRENLRSIKEFLDDVVDGGISVGFANNAGAAESPDSFNRYETHLVSIDGQVLFNLADIPKSVDKVNMSVNGQDMTNGIHFGVVGNVVTFDPIAANFILEAVNQFGQPDVILFKYVV